MCCSCSEPISRVNESVPAPSPRLLLGMRTCAVEEPRCVSVATRFTIHGTSKLEAFLLRERFCRAAFPDRIRRAYRLPCTTRRSWSRRVDGPPCPVRGATPYAGTAPTRTLKLNPPTHGKCLHTPRPTYTWPHTCANDAVVTQRPKRARTERGTRCQPTPLRQLCTWTHS